MRVPARKLIALQHLCESDLGAETQSQPQHFMTSEIGSHCNECLCIITTKFLSICYWVPMPRNCFFNSHSYFLILTPSECHRTNCYRKRHQDLGLCQLVRGYTTAVGWRAPSAVPSPTSGSQQLCLEGHYFSHSLMLLRNSLSELYTAVWMRRVRLRSPSDSKDSRCGEVSLHRLANPKPQNECDQPRNEWENECKGYM